MADGHHCSFVRRFHTLPGVTVKEKHTSLFMLLLEHISFFRKPEELDAILPQIKPRNVLEKILYLDILIYFKRFSELLQEFKSGDEIAVSKAIKNDWFIEEAFRNLDPVEFVNETLPTMPFNIRMKVLKRIVLDDEEQSDKLFEALVTRYGVFVATVFLTKCSTDKIRETLRKYPIKLSVNQMKAIFDKDSSLILVYIEEHKKNVGDTSFLNHNAILAYIAQQNPEMFFDLLNKHNFDTRLGNRTTKKFVMCKSDEIARKPKKYVKILHIAPLVRKLGDKNKEFFLNYFPRTKESAYWNVENLLKHYPKKIRFNIYRSTFDSIFHDKLCEGDLEYLTAAPLFDIMPDIVERERLATVKFNKTGQEHWIAYYQPHNAFNILKEKIDWLKASRQRQKFVTAAVRSCYVNKDTETFSKVLEFILNRLKNDVQVIGDLLQSMIFTTDHEFRKKLNDTHWRSILKINNVLDADDSCYYNTDLLKLYSIKFSLENNLPVDKSAVIIPNPFQYYVDQRIDHTLRKAHKYKIIRLLEITSERSEDDDDENDMLNSVCYIMRECKNYNEQNESDKIDIFNYPKVINFVKKIMDLDLLEGNVDLLPSMKVEYFICIDDSRPEVLELQNLYFKRLERYGSGKGLLWFLKYKPDLIKTHFDSVFKQLGDNFYWDLKRKSFWRLFKQYSHLDLDTMMIENILQKGKNEHQKFKTFVFVLSFLMPGPAYLEFAQQYIPQQSKVDIDDQETKKHYEIQNKVVKCMKNIDLKPEIYLPQVLQFCKGDYLKSALTSLYSCLCRMPEAKAREFISAIAKEPALSVNKHATALSCIILDQQTTLGYLENLPVSLSMTILKYFVKNYEDRFWVLFKSKFVQIDETSINMLELSNEIIIPISHRAEYFEAAWNLIEKFGNKRFKQALIEKIDKNVVNHMNCEIAAKIIDFNQFTVNLLLYNGSDEIVNMIVTKLQEFKDKNWSGENKNYLKKRKKISDFVELLFNTYLDMKAKDIIRDNVKPLALVHFRDKFVGVFSPVEAFGEFVKLHVITWRQEEVEVICKKLVDFHNEILQTYGAFACGFLFKTAKRFLNKRFQKEKKLMRLCQCLFNSRKNIDGDLLVVKLLPTSKIECCENIKIYGDILKALRETKNDTVKLHLNVYLMSLK